MSKESLPRGENIIPEHMMLPDGIAKRIGQLIANTYGAPENCPFLAPVFGGKTTIQDPEGLAEFLSARGVKIQLTGDIIRANAFYIMEGYALSVAHLPRDFEPTELRRKKQLEASAQLIGEKLADSVKKGSQLDELLLVPRGSGQSFASGAVQAQILRVAYDLRIDRAVVEECQGSIFHYYRRARESSSKSHTVRGSLLELLKRGVSRLR